MGVAGLLLGLVGSIWGMFVQVETLRWLLVLISIAGFVGACLAMSSPKWSGIIMLIAAIVGWIIAKGSFLWPGILLAVGGVFALISLSSAKTDN